MKQLSPQEFLDYCRNNNPTYIFGPNDKLAFKEVVYKSGSKLFVKCKGGTENEISITDEDYEKAYFSRMVMTADEYEGF